MRKGCALGIMFIFLVSGFSGCNEIINDDHKFLNKALFMANEIYPISYLHLISSEFNIDEYRIELLNYSLSTKCEKIREKFFDALFQIELAYSYAYNNEVSDKDLYTESIKLANEKLDEIRTDIKNLL